MISENRPQNGPLPQRGNSASASAIVTFACVGPVRCRRGDCLNWCQECPRTDGQLPPALYWCCKSVGAHAAGCEEREEPRDAAGDEEC